MIILSRSTIIIAYDFIHLPDSSNPKQDKFEFIWSLYINIIFCNFVVFIAYKSYVKMKIKEIIIVKDFNGLDL